MVARRVLVLAILGALPAGAVALAMGIGGVADYLDPCHRWGVGEGTTVTTEAGGRCASASSTGSTRLENAGFLVLVAGGLLAGVGLAVAGVVRSSPWLALAGTGILAVELVPMFAGVYYAGVIGFATLASLGVLLLAARLAGGLGPLQTRLVQGLGLVALVGLVLVLALMGKAVLLEGEDLLLAAPVVPLLLALVAGAGLVPERQIQRLRPAS